MVNTSPFTEQSIHSLSKIWTSLKSLNLDVCILKCVGRDRVLYFFKSSILVQVQSCSVTVELQWLEHLWNRENIFETGIVRASEINHSAR